MTRSENGDLVISGKTLKWIGLVGAAITFCGPALGIGIAVITRNADQRNEIATIKKRVDDHDESLKDLHVTCEDIKSKVNEAAVNVAWIRGTITKDKQP